MMRENEMRNKAVHQTLRARFLQVTYLAYIPVPRDGNCLFHALALYENISCEMLRSEAATYLELEAHARAEIAGTLLWLEEAARLRGPPEHNRVGHTALVAYCAMRNTTAVLHKMIQPGHFMELLQVGANTADGGTGHPTNAVHLLLHQDTGFYDGLVPIDDPTGFSPAWRQPHPPIYLFPCRDAAEERRKAKRPREDGSEAALTPRTISVKTLHTI